MKSGVIKRLLPEVFDGLEKVEAGLDSVHNGVSGRRIVIGA